MKCSNSFFIILNVLFLASIVFLPVPVEFFYRYGNHAGSLLVFACTQLITSVTLLLMWIVAKVDHFYLATITLPYLVGGIAYIAFGAFADRVFLRTGSLRRSYMYSVTALLTVSALCLYLAVSIPSAPGSVIFFTLAPIEVNVSMLSHHHDCTQVSTALC